MDTYYERMTAKLKQIKDDYERTGLCVFEAQPPNRAERDKFRKIATSADSAPLQAKLCKNLAKEQRRPFIYVDVRYRSREHGGRIEVGFPTAKYVAPLYASLLLVATEYKYNNPDAVQRRKNKMLFTRGAGYKLFDEWMHQLQTDPDLIKILKGKGPK